MHFIACLNIVYDQYTSIMPFALIVAFFWQELTHTSSPDSEVWRDLNMRDENEPRFKTETSFIHIGGCSADEGRARLSLQNLFDIDTIRAASSQL